MFAHAKIKNCLNKLLVAVAVSIMIASCGGGGGGDLPATTPAPVSTPGPTPTPSLPPLPTAATFAAEVKKSASISIDIPVISGASDPFGGNVAGTAILDFDGDGQQDLVITPSYLSIQPELSIILLKGTTTGFIDATKTVFGSSVPTTGVARTPLVADFNGDGKDDYFAADTGLEVVEKGNYVYAQNRYLQSDGASISSSQVGPVAFNHGACQGDIDGDGRRDIVVTPLSAPKTYILMNTTDGFVFSQLKLPPELITYTVEDFNPSSCALVDLNGDGKLDLVAAGYKDGVAEKQPNSPYATGVRIYLNDGSGNFSPSEARVARPPSADWGSTSIRVADFDKNGKPDLLIAYEATDRRFALQLLVQNPKGELEDKTVANFGAYETNVGFWRELDIGDFDGNGSTDIYLRRIYDRASIFSDELRKSILLNDGAGKFSTLNKPITLSQAIAPAFLVVAGSNNGILTFVGYETTSANGTYNGLVPLSLNINLKP